MASKQFVAAFVLCFLVLCVVGAWGVIESGGPKRSLVGIDCVAACAIRCKLSSRSNLCRRACGTCCDRCGCVPPGTSGNQEFCHCYYNQTTHGGKHKCP